MPGIGTWGDVTTDANSRSFTLYLMDASGDLWTERLVVALSATLTAIQAWVALYQAVTQASVYGVEENIGWFGDADPDNATFLARFGIETGINLGIKNADTSETRPLRVVAPIAAVMQGMQDIPLLSATAMSALIVATLALQPDFNLTHAQYTVHRERKNNPRVK
jgi:hypothetical protein